MKRHGTIESWNIVAFFALGACGPSVVVEDPKDEGWPMPNPASAGLPNPSSYTVDATNNIVIDDVTGLKWQRTVDDSEFTWSKAKEYCDNLVLGDSDDWRLPSRIELVSLLDFTRIGPAIDTNAFPNGPSGVFWTSSVWTDPGHPNNTAFTVYFSVGYTSGADFLDSVYPNTFRARCVQHGQANAPQGHYTIMNGSVYDTKTKLTWQQTISSSSFTWSEAQNHCSNLTLDGDGWRVPSLKELQTIVDETKSYPAIDPNAFPDTPLDEFWTSSLKADAPNLAWYVDFSRVGVTFHNSVMATNQVRCVR